MFHGLWNLFNTANTELDDIIFIRRTVRHDRFTVSIDRNAELAGVTEAQVAAAG